MSSQGSLDPLVQFCRVFVHSRKNTFRLFKKSVVFDLVMGRRPIAVCQRAPLVNLQGRILQGGPKWELILPISVPLLGIRLFGIARGFAGATRTSESSSAGCNGTMRAVSRSSVSARTTHSTSKQQSEHAVISATTGSATVTSSPHRASASAKSEDGAGVGT